MLAIPKSRKYLKFLANRSLQDDNLKSWEAIYNPDASHSGRECVCLAGDSIMCLTQGSGDTGRKQNPSVPANEKIKVETVGRGPGDGVTAHGLIFKTI